MALTGQYRAEDFTPGIGSQIDGALIHAIPDNSGNGRTLLQGTDANKPRFMLDQLNGLPSMRFDGVNDWLDTVPGGAVLSDFLGTNGVGTVISLVRVKHDLQPTPDGTDHGIWGINANAATTGGTLCELRYAATSPRFRCRGRTSTGLEQSTQLTPYETNFSDTVFTQRTSNRMTPGHITGIPKIVMWQFDGSFIYCGVDNLDDVALNSNSSLALNALSDELLFGKTFEFFWLGDIFEVSFWNTALTQDERRAEVLALTEKYALHYQCGGVPNGSALPESASVKVEMYLPTAELQVNTPQLEGGSSNPSPVKLGRFLRPSVWLKADAITGLVDDDPVGVWADSSGNGFNFTAAINDERPLWKATAANGMPAVRFDGIDDLLTSSENLERMLGYDGWGAVYVVARVDVQDDGLLTKSHPLISVGSGFHLFALEKASAGDTIRARNQDAGGNDDVEQAVTLDQWGIYMWTHSKGTGPLDDVPDTLTVRVDNIDNGVASGVTVSSVLQNLVRVGGASANFSKADIAEVLIFPKAHSNLTRLHVNWYFKEKYTIIDLEAEPEKWWVDVTEDVLMREPIRLQSGIRSSRGDDRVAAPGSLSLSMNNAIDNSSGAIGYYSPEHANVRDGWGLGIRIRIGYAHHGTTYYKWTGFVKDIAVRPGLNNFAVDVKGVDWIDYAARMFTSRLPIRENEDAGLLTWRLYSNSPLTPESVVVQTGLTTYPFAFDEGLDEGHLILSELYKIVISEYGFLTLRGDIQGGGRLYLETIGDRSYNNPFVRWAVSSVEDLRLDDYSLDNIANRVVLKGHPRRVDEAATTELFRLQSEMEIEGSNGVLSFVAPYRDPTGRSVRVGGKDMVTPVATTDYTMFSATGGGGSDNTVDLDVTITFGANSAKVDLINTGAGTGFINLFKLRGKGLYYEEAFLVDVSDAVSINKYGQMMLSIDMPYQGLVHVVYSLANLLLTNYKEPVPRVKNVGFTLNKTGDTAMNALARGISERVAVTESVSGLTAEEYYINGYEMATIDGITQIRWTLLPIDLELGL